MNEIPYVWVVGVSSCVGDYLHHILMFDLDSPFKKDVIYKVSETYNVDLHLFKSSGDGIHIISFDVFDDLDELDMIQKALRKSLLEHEEKPYMTILEIIAEGAIHGDAHSLALRQNIPLPLRMEFMSRRTKWRSNVLRVGHKKNKCPPRFLESILAENDVRPLSRQHMDIYRMLGFKKPLSYKNRVVTDAVTCASIYKTKHRLAEGVNEDG